MDNMFKNLLNDNSVVYNCIIKYNWNIWKWLWNPIKCFKRVRRLRLT